MRQGDWIQTYTGKRFWPLAPSTEDFSIEDIAHALSLTCRFNGHCSDFYSVAEHSVYAFQKASPENKRAALLHEISEAYISDMTRPVKPYIAGYAEIEEGIMRAGAVRYGFKYPFHPEIKEIDNRLLKTEKLRLMDNIGYGWGLDEVQEYEDLEIRCLPWWQAKEEFLSAYESLR